VRVEDSGRDSIADSSIESLLNLYRHEEYVLRVLSPGLIEILTEDEEGRVC